MRDAARFDAMHQLVMSRPAFGRRIFNARSSVLAISLMSCG
jgi:hypothetical protein